MARGKKTERAALTKKKLPKNVEKIGNKFWGWNYTYYEEYDSLSYSRWKGCDAIRMRIDRGKSTTDK